MKNPDDAGAASTDYLHLSGLVALGYMWGRMVKVAQDRLAEDGVKGFCENKIVTGRYFMERVMPETAAHLARISSGSATMMSLPAEAF
jgi:acyl-CoA dehydrogenase